MLQFRASHTNTSATETVNQLQNNFTIVHPDRYHTAIILKKSHVLPEEVENPMGFACLNVDYHDSCEIIHARRSVLYLFS